MDFRLITGVPFLTQVGLLALVFLAALLAKTKHLKAHCLVMRVAVLVQIVNVVRGMFPSLLSHLRTGLPVDSFVIEMIVHAAVGIAVIAIWVFVNLASSGLIKWRRRLVWPMRTAFALWMVNFAIGSHIYLSGRL